LVDDEVIDLDTTLGQQLLHVPVAQAAFGARATSRVARAMSGG
jgi:hypothetical protein